MQASDIAGAFGDILGNPVTINGRTHLLLDEVTNALNGLKAAADDIRGVMARNDLTDAQRDALQSPLSSVSNHIDDVERILDTARKTRDAID